MIDEFLPALPLSFEVTNMDTSNAEYESSGQPAGSFHFSSSGSHRICIGNGVGQDSDRETRTVGFSIRVKTINHPHDDSPGPLTAQMSAIDDMTDDLLLNLEELLDHLEIMGERERSHRDVTEKTFRNVWFWTLIEKVVLVVVSVGQVMYIKYYMGMKRGL